MANLSEAAGEWIVPTALIRENRKLIYQAIEEINGNDMFGFNWLDYDFDQGDVDDKTIKEVEIPFNGTGRWNFEATCSHLLQPGYYDEKDYSHWNALMKIIRRRSIKTRIHFEDIEIGSRFYYEQNGIFNGSQYIVQKEKNFAFTLENIICDFYMQSYNVEFVEVKNIHDVLECCQENKELTKKIEKLNNEEQSKLVSLIHSNDYLKGLLTSDCYDPLNSQKIELLTLINKVKE